MIRALLSLGFVLVASAVQAQTTTLPNTTVLPQTTLVAASSVVNGTFNTDLIDATTNNGTGNADAINYYAFIWRGGGTLTALSTWWGISESDTWGLAIYNDTTSGCASAAPHCPGSKICSTTTTGSVSVGYNTLAMSGCSMTIGNLYYYANFTGSATQENGLNTNYATVCPNGTNLPAYLNFMNGSASFPSSDGGAAIQLTGNCVPFYATITCSGTCPITFETISTSLPLPGGPVTNVSWTTFVPAATHQAVVIQITYDGSTGSHASSCTDNSVSMTQVIAPVAGSGGTLFGASYFIIPSTGNNAFSCNVTSGEDVIAVAELWAGVNQTGTVGNSWRSGFTATDGGSASPIATIAVTNTTAASDVILDFTAFDTVGTVTAQTSNHNQIYSTINPSGSAIQFVVQWAQGTGSSVTMTETQTTAAPSPTWAIGAFALVAG